MLTVTSKAVGRLGLLWPTLSLLGAAVFVNPMPGHAQITQAHSAYFDVVFGHCFEVSGGGAVRDSSFSVADWAPYEGWTGTEQSLNTEAVRAGLQLVFAQFDSAEIVVDLANQETCWSQFSGDDAATLAASIRVDVLGRPNSHVFDERLEFGQERESISRVTTMGWYVLDDSRLPVLIMRELISPPNGLVTVQVVTGQQVE